MGILWFNEKPKDGVATITPAHITLNKAAATFFESAYNIMLGIDEDNKQIVIRPLSKEESVRRDIAQTKKYRISVRSSYARVTNKAFIEELQETFELKFDDQESIKYKALWDQKENLLKIDLKEVL